jgi:hypothetical protein
MVTTTANYNDSRYRTTTGDGLDGVVRVSLGGYYATGALLFDGRALLTAAHLFKGGAVSATVSFATPNGTQTVIATKFLPHPDYDSESNNDLAIVWLNKPAPVSVTRYDLYRKGDEIGQVFTMSGFGRVGTGETGSSSEVGNPIKLKASNRFDADIGTLKSSLGGAMGWLPKAGTQLVADFDNGKSAHDALGRLMGTHDLGLGLNEGLIAQGDSGGPAFIQNKIAGVATYTASLSRGVVNPDVDASQNSSFGEIGAWQRVSHYQQWIDQSLRANYPDAPRKPEDVKKEIVEGHSGINYAYFLVQFTGIRSAPAQVVSVDFATRDGTAKAGSDYIAVSGVLNLYPDENQAVIPVEVLGDYTPEPDEIFFLDVMNPIGGSFGHSVVKLTAMRTIIDDDGWF